MNGSAPGLVARWTSRRYPAAGSICDECRELVVDMECRCCGQLAGELVGMLAVVVDTAAGARLVIAEHAADGWVPIQSVPATRANVTALSRPGATGPALAGVSTVGRMW